MGASTVRTIRGLSPSCKGSATEAREYGFQSLQVPACHAQEDMPRAYLMLNRPRRWRQFHMGVTIRVLEHGALMGWDECAGTAGPQIEYYPTTLPPTAMATASASFSADTTAHHIGVLSATTPFLAGFLPYT